ncbi:MAG: dTDP-glucose 4,6-dehydratase [Leptospiraceae bacterium]|nr:dTDP-glucose 4,6-dehydratase [Leptospiraceae bacterium]
MRKIERVLVTGGAGFIGANFLHYLLKKNFSGRVVNLDALTYAAEIKNLSFIESKLDYRFVHGSIVDKSLLEKLFEEEKFDTIVHFAAESHVDNSILGPGIFIETNVQGTFQLLETSKNFWKKNHMTEVLFHHISTDEVYGSLGKHGYFTEKTPYDPSSPYSASKAASDHLVKAYHKTYQLPVTISNCSNNYGQFQNAEKLIPLIIKNAFLGKKLPVYGQGVNIRDWLYVEDHCSAIWEILLNSKVGECYNVGGNNEWKNIDVVNLICKLLPEYTDKTKEYYESLIEFVTDRPGHDLRYAIDATKIKEELGWLPKETFETGIKKTIEFYVNRLKENK